MKSKTKIEKQIQKKKDLELVQTLIKAKKEKAWQEVAGLLSGPSRKRSKINLSDIEEKAEEGKIVLIPGKVLSMGNLTKKVKVVALKFSEGAKEKLLNSKHEVSTILEEIGKNPEGKEVQIIK